MKLLIVKLHSRVGLFSFFFTGKSMDDNFKIDLDVVTESQATGDISKDKFEQIKVEPESILNLAEQNKDTTNTSELSKYFYKSCVHMNGKLFLKTNTITFFSV